MKFATSWKEGWDQYRQPSDTLSQRDGESMGSPVVQNVLFAIGIVLSVALWAATWKRIHGWLALCWRVYVTAFLTAGVPMPPSDSTYYLLFWTIALSVESNHLVILLMWQWAIAVYFTAYMLVITPIWLTFRERK